MKLPLWFALKDVIDLSAKGSICQSLRMLQFTARHVSTETVAAIPLSHLCSSSRGSLRFYDRSEPQIYREDRNPKRYVNFAPTSARQPQPSADKNIARTAENRGLTTYV